MNSLATRTMSRRLRQNLGVFDSNRGSTYLRTNRSLEQVVASYEAVPLLSEYAPRINPQQLKNALVSRAECSRVVKMIEEHGKLTPDSLYAAVERTSSCRGTERAKVAVRFLRDFICFHRDLRRLEALNAGTDSVNLIGNDKPENLALLTERCMTSSCPMNNALPKRKSFTTSF